MTLEEATSLLSKALRDRRSPGIVSVGKRDEDNVIVVFADSDLVHRHVISDLRQNGFHGFRVSVAYGA